MSEKRVSFHEQVEFRSYQSYLLHPITDEPKIDIKAKLELGLNELVELIPYKKKTQFYKRIAKLVKSRKGVTINKMDI
ncbi:hypothetical protein K502DRAFT_324078 [Neoconidiobolus thromboides FSU 785]|nr:hypothetical protein K502DRAFT_324078 [Neoconidiobolus thromboides FSU 785]